jgi:hypothetical protein
LPEEKAGARVHGDVARLDDEVVLRHDDQLAPDDEEVDANVSRGRVATDQPGVADDDPFDVGRMDYRSGGTSRAESRALDG